MNQQTKRIPLTHFQCTKDATMNDFEYISEWLTDAYNNHKELKGYALYHILNGLIYDAFKDKTVFLLRYEGKAVAFLTFEPPSKDSIRIIFRTVCVKPDFLRMGLATHLHKNAIEHFQQQGCLIAELWHVCPEAYKLGTSMGFVSKTRRNKTEEVSMVKILVDTRKQNRNAKIRFVVWGNSYADTNTRPIYSWSLCFHKDKKPIIRSIDFEWTVGIIKNNKVVYSQIAKCFFDIYPRGGNYIYINENKAEAILSEI